MKAVLLCGGVGKRMAPLTTPKSLLRIAGVAILRHQINVAVQAGLRQFLIIANPENLRGLQNAIDGIPDVSIDFAIQRKATGMADALLTVLPDIHEPFLLASGDDIVEVTAYQRLLAEIANDREWSAFITTYQVKEHFPGGYLVMDADRMIQSIVEKPPRGSEPSQLVNIVLHLFREPGVLLKYLRQATAGGTDDAYETALDRMIRQGHRLKAVLYPGVWHAIKYPWQVLEVMDYYLKQLEASVSPSAHISDRAVIDGLVSIADGARILEGAVIRGPAYIGRGSIIGNNTLVRQANIGDNCVVGFNSEIKRTYVGDGCWFHSNYVGDSVIEADCSFGAGTVTANLRLDSKRLVLQVDEADIPTGQDKLGAFVGKGARLGANVTLLPGTRIGAGAMVGAQICVSADIPAGKIAIAEPNYRVLPFEMLTGTDRESVA